MENKQIRTLYANEIDCRVGTVNATGFSILLYKDARVDMKLLDEVYGPNGWQRTHEVINGNLFCNIEVWDDEKKCWVKKQDVGTESNTEKEKGEASDSFKRAGFNWGIGRELYTAPFIWITGYEDYIEKKDNGKSSVKPSLKLRVSKIEYNKDKEIEKLELKDNKSRVAFSYGMGVNLTKNDNSDELDERLKLLVEFKKLLIDTETDSEKVYEVYKVQNDTEMTNEQFRDAIKILKQKPVIIKKSKKKVEEVF